MVLREGPGPALFSGIAGRIRQRAGMVFPPRSGCRQIFLEIISPSAIPGTLCGEACKNHKKTRECVFDLPEPAYPKPAKRAGVISNRLFRLGEPQLTSERAPGGRRLSRKGGKDRFRPVKMKKILHMNHYTARIRGLIALLLVAVFGLAAIGIAPGDAVALKKKKKKKDEVGYLGISMQALTEDIIEGLDLKIERGVLISEVFDDSPAENAGIEDGDIIIEYDGKEIDSTKELLKLVRETDVGEEVAVKVVRDDNTETFFVKIGERPENFFVKRYRDIEPRVLQIFSPGARLGVKIQDLEDEDLAAYFNVEEGEGVLVMGVEEESAAEEAGVKAGDVIVELNDEDIESSDELIDAVGEMEAGDDFELVVIRHGSRKTLTGEIKEGGKRKIQIYSDYFPHKEDWIHSLYFDESDLGDMKEKLKDLKWHVGVDRDDLKEELQKLKEELMKLKERLKELEED